MRIRELDAEERAELSLPLQTYSFRPSPRGNGSDDQLRQLQPYLRDNLTLVVEDGGDVVAEASAIPMRQNVRGLVCPMAGIAGVASNPLHRRRGHVRTLLTELLGRMRDRSPADPAAAYALGEGGGHRRLADAARTGQHLHAAGGSTQRPPQLPGQLVAAAQHRRQPPDRFPHG
ncbi:GNAT family N-acetyltransferase [Micromonospora sp. NBC_01699]|uniref:GNAT family N-acetyltransferase n=1 Tax=Micromonospora sp. NBC_01699 TaxID=2975984 RepID=UPI002E2AB94F|nr:GNAT family N-acetyltransferase [Micromonospora sp. NBC_01699]